MNKLALYLFVYFVMMLAGCSNDNNGASNENNQPLPANIESSTSIDNLASIESDQYFLKRLDSYVNGELSVAYEYNVDYLSGTITRSQINLEGNPVDTIYYFDKKGDLLKVEYFSQNELKATETMQRASDGKLSGFSVQLLQGREDVTFRYLDGKLIEREIANENIIDTGTFSYNPDGTLATLVEIRDVNGQANTTTFFYNTENQRTATQWDNGSDGSVEESTSIDYDENGNVQAIDFYSDTGELTERDEFVFESSELPIANIIKFQMRYLP